MKHVHTFESSGLSVDQERRALRELSSLWQAQRRFYPTMARERAQELMQEWEHAVRQATAA